MTKKPLLCRNCGKPRKYRKKFCSQECFFEFYRIHTREETYGKEMADKIAKAISASQRLEKTCIQCGKKFISGQCTQLYCSPKCRRKYTYDKNPEKMIQYVLKSRKLHMDHFKKYQREYNLKNHEEIKRRMDKYNAKYRKNHLATIENGKPITYKDVVKRPKPVDNKCEVCGKVHGKGHLDYHHWEKIEKAPKVTPGIWVGNKCHLIIEYNEQKYAKMIFKKYLEEKTKIIKELGD